jgi:methylated-DNA-[protein]-cysteine S-methyltransferase
MRESPVLIGSIHASPLKEVWAAVSEEGLTRVEFGVSRSDFTDAVRSQTRREVEYAPERLEEVTAQIKEYLNGVRRRFKMRINWQVLSSDFQRQALQAVFSIPYGQTRSYAEIAAQIGHPDAPRAMGRANATNPMPLVIPCHRVIGSDGKLHGYGGAGGLKTKAWLLDLEDAPY